MRERRKARHRNHRGPRRASRGLRPAPTPSDPRPRRPPTDRPRSYGGCRLPRVRDRAPGPPDIRAYRPPGCGQSTPSPTELGEGSPKRPQGRHGGVCPARQRVHRPTPSKVQTSNSKMVPTTWTTTDSRFLPSAALHRLSSCLRFLPDLHLARGAEHDRRGLLPPCRDFLPDLRRQLHDLSELAVTHGTARFIISGLLLYSGRIKSCDILPPCAEPFILPITCPSCYHGLRIVKDMDPCMP